MFFFAVLPIVGLLVVGWLCVCTDGAAGSDRMVGVQDSAEPMPRKKVSQEPPLIQTNGRFEGENAGEPDANGLEDELVNGFDALTDRWMEPERSGVALSDAEDFSRAFRQIPKARQDECVHRALNLIPDENVMLLVGILMDKSMDREIVETVFHDILNRDEDVKMPILKEIFKDRSHPCWSDAAWILDVTGEKPSE